MKYLICIVSNKLPGDFLVARLHHISKKVFQFHNIYLIFLFKCLLATLVLNCYKQINTLAVDLYISIG